MNKIIFAVIALSAGLYAQFLPLVSASPATIAADSDATKVTVTGDSFTPGMVVKWNGQTRATEFLDQHTLRVTLTADNIAKPSLGYLAVWDATGTVQLTDTASILVYIAVVHNDVVYDPLRGKIYIAVSQKEKLHGGSIAVLNPETARMERYFPVEFEPELLAISPDRHYLYAALGNVIRRINLDSWSAEADIPLGSDQLFGPRRAESMVALPGANTSLVVSILHAGTTIFDGTHMRAQTATDIGGGLIGGPDDSTIYMCNGSFEVLKLDSTAITVQQSVPDLCGDAVLADGLLYTTWGAAIDPTGPTLVNTFGMAGLIQALPEKQAVLIVDGELHPGYAPYDQVTLAFIDTTSGYPIWSVPIPAHLDINRGSLIHWGSDGIAFRDQDPYGSPSKALYVFRVNLSRDATGPFLPAEQ